MAGPDSVTNISKHEVSLNVRQKGSFFETGQAYSPMYSVNRVKI
jgi:hypothetical protein